MKKQKNSGEWEVIRCIRGDREEEQVLFLRNSKNGNILIQTLDGKRAILSQKEFLEFRKKIDSICSSCKSGKLSSADMSELPSLRLVCDNCGTAFLVEEGFFCRIDA